VMVRPVCAEANLLGEQRLGRVGSTARQVLAAPSIKGRGRTLPGIAVAYEFIPLLSQRLDLDFSRSQDVSGVLERLLEHLVSLLQSGEFDLRAVEFGFGGVMLATHGVERAGGSGGTERTTRTCTGTVRALGSMQLDTQVGTLLLEPVHGVGDRGEVAGGEGDVFVVRVVVVAAEGAEGKDGAAEGEELDGGLVEVSEMEVSDREHCGSLLGRITIIAD
jgi:hypothetical protein